MAGVSEGRRKPRRASQHQTADATPTPVPDKVDNVAGGRQHHVLPPLVPIDGLLVWAAHFSQHPVDLDEVREGEREERH